MRGINGEEARAVNKGQSPQDLLKHARVETWIGSNRRPLKDSGLTTTYLDMCFGKTKRPLCLPEETRKEGRLEVQGPISKSSRYSVKQHRTPAPPPPPPPQVSSSRWFQVFGCLCPMTDMWHRIIPELRRGSTAEQWTDNWELSNHDEKWSRQRCCILKFSQKVQRLLVSKGKGRLIFSESHFPLKLVH